MKQYIPIIIINIYRYIDCLFIRFRARACNSGACEAAGAGRTEYRRSRARHQPHAAGDTRPAAARRRRRSGRRRALAEPPPTHALSPLPYTQPHTW